MFSSSQQINSSSNVSGTPRWRKTNPVLIYRRAGKELSMELRPWVSAIAFSIFGILISAIIVSSGYLFFRDDILARSMDRYETMEAGYEQRIAALRSRLDLVTSRQLIDQQVVENRVSELMARQEKLAARENELRKALGRAEEAKALRPTIQRGPEKRSSLTTGTVVASASSLRLGKIVGTDSPFRGINSGQKISIAQADDRFFDSFEESLAKTERSQLAELYVLKRNADSKAQRLARILDKQGIRIPADTAIGGPLIQLKEGNAFLNSINALDHALEVLEKVRSAAKSLPHGSPTPGKRISSTFGTRKDPFTGNHAMHGGLDFSAKRGAPVVATASGKITKAGRMGGYGKLIEINHGGGITTRYAHLSRIKVKVGQKIRRGTVIGKVGSTGRSTGPHLHYEVRRKGRVLNPIHYVRLEKHLKPYL